MKITILIDNFANLISKRITGIERFIINIALNLEKLGNNIQFITSLKKNAKQYDQYLKFPILRIKDSRTFLGKLGLLFGLHYITFSLNLVRKKFLKYFINSDIIILNFPILFSFFFKLKNIQIVPIFYHYNPIKEIKDYFSLLFIHLLEKITYKNKKLIITISKASKEALINFYNVKEQNIIIINPGVDRDKFNPDKFSKKIRDKYGKNIILYVGLMNKRKRVTTLIKAMPEVIQNIPESHLILIGDGPELKKCQKLSKSLKIENNVSFLGYVNDMELPKYYASSDIYVLPSIIEGFGQVILEAMACGTPVLCVDKKPMSDIIGKGGETFSLKDSKDLSKKLIYLLKNKDYLNLLRNNAIVQSKKFKWENAAKKIDTILKKLLKNDDFSF
ncbi:MAG: glycosyltransferase family 4 protein [Promethearchaeia archaeon]